MATMRMGYRLPRSRVWLMMSAGLTMSRPMRRMCRRA